jgi:hypothetical protein
MWLPVIDKQLSRKINRLRCYLYIVLGERDGRRAASVWSVKWGCTRLPVLKIVTRHLQFEQFQSRGSMSMHLAIFTAKVSTFRIRNQNLVLNFARKILCRYEKHCEILYCFLSFHRICEIVRLDICDICVKCAVLVNVPKLWLYYHFFPTLALYIVKYYELCFWYSVKMGLLVVLYGYETLSLM